MTTTGITYQELLKNVLNLNDDEISHLNSAGIGDIMDWKTLNEDDVTNMVAQIRKEKWEKTPGTPVYKTFRVVQERNLKTLWSEVRIHYELNMGIKLILEDSPDSDHLKAWEARRKEREAFADPPSDQRPLSATISRNWVKGFELLDEWISSHVEDSYKIPLSVMIRPAAANKWNDAWKGKNLLTLYSTFCPRATWRTPTGGGTKTKVVREYVAAGSVKLWQILFAIFQDHPAYSHIKSFRKERDGIGAYNSLRQHYLGRNAVNNMATELEAEFNNLSYNGETRRWNFEKYVTKHVELYNRVQELEAYGYSGMDVQSRVRKFISGIKTAKLDVVKTSVLADPKLQSDFDRVANLYKDYICQDKSLNSSKRDAANIAGVQGGQSNGNNRNGRNGRNNQNQGGNSNGSDNNRNSNGRNVSDVSVQDRYYTKEEYAKLSADEKAALYRMRKRRKTDGGGSNNGGNLNANLSALVTSMAAQLSAMNQNGQENDSNGQQAPEESNGASEGGNSTHPALRQRTRGRS